MALEAPPASSPAVHNVMIANTSKDTKPELRVRRMLREAGYPGYRLHWRIDDEDGRYVCRPDITQGGSWRYSFTGASGTVVPHAT